MTDTMLPVLPRLVGSRKTFQVADQKTRTSEILHACPVVRWPRPNLCDDGSRQSQSGASQAAVRIRLVDHRQAPRVSSNRSGRVGGATYFTLTRSDS
jgi:hypothetical protein